MKNTNENGGNWVPDPQVSVSVSVDEAPLLKDLVQKLAHRHNRSIYNPECPVEGWKSVETSTIEAFVSGSMDLFGENDHISMSYTTCFSFTCTRLPGQDNVLSWLNSLS